MLHPNFVILGTVIVSTGSLAYLMGTIKGKIKPNRVSFILWSIAPFIAFTAQIKQGVGLEALMTFTTGFFPLMIFITSFFNKKSNWKLSRLDLMCGVFSIFGLILWLITKVGNIAIIFSILSNSLAAIPTIIKAYKYPDTEIAWPWLATVIGITLTLLTLSRLTFINSGFIIGVLIINAITFCLVQFRIGEKMGFVNNL